MFYETRLGKVYWKSPVTSVLTPEEYRYTSDKNSMLVESDGKLVLVHFSETTSEEIAIHIPALFVFPVGTLW